MILNPNNTEEIVVSSPTMTKAKLGFDIASLVSNDGARFENKMVAIAPYFGKSNAGKIHFVDNRFHPYHNREVVHSSDEETKRSSSPKSTEEERKNRHSFSQADIHTKRYTSPKNRSSTAGNLSTESNLMHSYKNDRGLSSASNQTNFFNGVSASYFDKSSITHRPRTERRTPSISPSSNKIVSPHQVKVEKSENEEDSFVSTSPENQNTSHSPLQRRRLSSGFNKPLQSSNGYFPNGVQLPSPVDCISNSPPAVFPNPLPPHCNGDVPGSAMDRFFFRAAAAAAAGLGGAAHSPCVPPVSIPSTYMPSMHPNPNGLALPMDPLIGSAIRNPFLPGGAPPFNPWLLRQGRPMPPPPFAGKKNCA